MNARRALLAAALAAGSAAACGGLPPPWRWRDGAAATAEVRVREELLPTRISREVQVAFAGRAAAPAGGRTALDLEILRVRHDRCAADGAASTVETTDVSGRPGARAAQDEAIARVAEALVHRRVRLEFDPADGLASVAGMDEALAAAAAPGDAPAAEARDGLRGLLSDAALRRALRAAGMTAPPEDFRDFAAVKERRIDVFLPGAGLAALRMLGTAGEEGDGSPVLRLSGRMRDDAPVSGDPGPAPPPEIGPVRAASVEAESETLYDRDTRTPLRGRATVRLPYACGATVAVRTSFTMAVGP